MKKICLILMIWAPPLVAKPACDELAGSVVFYDSLYGVATGAVLAGLFLAAADDGDEVGRKVAGAALGGGLIGAGVGLAELGMRDCGSSAAEVRSQPGWRATVSFHNEEVFGGVAWRW